MIGVTKLLCEDLSSIKGKGPSPALPRYSPVKRPVIVWNLTYSCNLRCEHCYSDSLDRSSKDELSTLEALELIEGLARYGVPAIIFSGGEPLLRKDVFLLGKKASGLGVRATLSSNGTLLKEEGARRLLDSGFSYVGVSIDGGPSVNDRFRGRTGAYIEAIEGLRRSIKMGLKVGLRMTLTRKTVSELPFLFKLAEEEGVKRLYIAHLVYVGRGRKIAADALGPGETRKAVDFIFSKARDLYRKGVDIEVVTGNNDTDGVYLYLNLLKEDPERAKKVYTLLKIKGGNSSGVSIGCIDPFGNVHPDQYWRHHILGNVRRRDFSDIWARENDPVLRGLRNREAMFNKETKCGRCPFFEVCKGNYRVRAEAFSGDLWGDDPACYLTKRELNLD